MIYLVLALVYYLAKEFEEASWENTYPTHWSSWWNNERSWVNKHQWGNLIADKIGFGHKLLTFSFKTFLSFATDASHFFQMIKMVSIMLIVWYAGGFFAAGMFFAGYYLGGTIKVIMQSFGIYIIK